MTGLTLGIFHGRWLARCVRPDRPRLPDVLTSLSLWFVPVGLIGAHALHVVSDWPEYARDPWRVLILWKGLAFLGGFTLALLFALLYLHHQRELCWPTMNILASMITLAHAFGRIGCFLAGCCHGRPTSSSMGIALRSALVDAQLRGVPLHPTQLYEASALLIMVGVLTYLTLRAPRSPWPSITYLAGYGTIRWVVELFRGDPDRGHLPGTSMSTSQLIATLLLLSALVLTVQHEGRRRTEGRDTIRSLGLRRHRPHRSNRLP